MRHYFVRGEYIISSRPSFVPVHNTIVLPTGKAFFCPSCAEVWALAPIDKQETFVEHIPCDKHSPTPTRPDPGSLFLPWDATWNSDLPTKLLVREFFNQLRIKELQDSEFRDTNVNGTNP